MRPDDVCHESPCSHYPTAVLTVLFLAWAADACTLTDSEFNPLKFQPSTTEAEPVDPDVCDVRRFGGNRGAAVQRADRIIGTAGCRF